MDKFFKPTAIAMVGASADGLGNALAFLPKVPASCRTAIVTLSGGAGILACDALEARGIPVARLAEETERELGKIFPPWMPASNPVDLFPAIGLHGHSLRTPMPAGRPGDRAGKILPGVVLPEPDLGRIRQQTSA